MCHFYYHYGLPGNEPQRISPFAVQNFMVPFMDNGSLMAVRPCVVAVRQIESKIVLNTDNAMTEPDKKLKKETERSWKDEWFNFSQSSTMHGICKVTEDTPFTARRYGF